MGTENGGRHSAIRDHAPDIKERRYQRRAKVRWPVILFTRDQVVSTFTENLCCQGFYCFSTVMVRPGERIQCKIELPNGERAGAPVALLCRVKVVRVEVGLQLGFGLGCYIEESMFVSGST